MNKILSITLITIITLFSTVFKVNATVLTQGYISLEIGKQAQEIIKREIKSNINIDIDNSYISSVEVYGNKYKIQVLCNSEKFNPITIFKVNILSNGSLVKTFGVPVKISIFETVAVAANNIYRGEFLSSNNIKYENKEISFIYDNVMKESDTPEGFIANKIYRQGEIIDKRYIATPPDVLMHTPISIIFKNDDITVSLDGEAMDNGKIGDYIRVNNKTYKKQYKGQIIDNNTVMVKL
ncbi:MAG: flagellar basal body P-ring formation chaperone FlgA [bacterium]